MQRPSIRAGRPVAALRTVLSLIVLLSCVATSSVVADEVSVEQEKKRAILREFYVAAKAAEKEALDKYQAALERISGSLRRGTETIADLEKKRKDATARFDEKRQDLRRAEKALDVALGSHGKDVSDPAVIAAQEQRDKIAAEVAALENEIASYKQRESEAIELPRGNDPLYRQLIEADLEGRRQETIRAFVGYLAGLKPSPPPYLQSVTVFAGTRRMYNAEWRVEAEAADAATQAVAGRLDQLARDLNRAIDEMESERKELKTQREALFEALRKADMEINLAAVEIDSSGVMAVLAPATIEIAGVLLEMSLTGGFSTVERKAAEMALARGQDLAGALAKKEAGKALSVTEQSVIRTYEKAIDTVAKEKEIDALLVDIPSAWAGKHGADKFNYHKANSLIDKLGLKPGSSEATKIVVGDAAEQAITRTGKVVSTVLTYKTANGLAAATADQIGVWERVRVGATTFYKAKTPLPNIKEAFKGPASANLLGLAITSAKALAAAYYGHELGKAEERFAENMGLYSVAYGGYYGLLQTDALLAEKQQEFRNLYFEALAYRLFALGPRELKVLLDEGNEDRSETLTFRLRFSPAIDQAPAVRIAETAIEMRAVDKDQEGRGAYWEGSIQADQLPEATGQVVLEVALADGSKPYPALDARPETPTRFKIPEDLVAKLPDRDEWSDYERGTDQNHRITIKPSGFDRCLVGNWEATEVGFLDDIPYARSGGTGFKVTFTSDGTQTVDYSKMTPVLIGNNGDGHTYRGSGSARITTKDKTAKIVGTLISDHVEIHPSLLFPEVPFMPLVAMGPGGLGSTDGTNDYVCTEDSLSYKTSNGKGAGAARTWPPQFAVKLKRLQ